MPERHYRVVGLLDDDPAKARRRLQGIPVLGPVSSLPRMCREHQIGEILIAMPSASSLEMQRIISLCRATQMDADVHGAATSSAATPLRFRTVPSLQDILAGKAQVNQIREVSVADVLGRDTVEMDLAAVGGMLHHKVVLVSGAGGSIGSELCRTICRFEPACLVLVDKAENAIFEIERELRRSWPAIRLVPAIGPHRSWISAAICAALSPPTSPAARVSRATTNSCRASPPASRTTTSAGGAASTVGNAADDGGAGDGAGADGARDDPPGADGTRADGTGGDAGPNDCWGSRCV